MKHILFLTSLFICFPCFPETASARENNKIFEIVAGNCYSYNLEDNSAIFSCENDIKVKVKIIRTGIIRIWYDRGNSNRNNESYAVINEGDDSGHINISELPQSYEIYTGDLIVRISKAPFSIRIYDKYQKLLLEDFNNWGYVKDTLKISSYKTMKQGERIYGLGEKNGPINRVGGSYKMWNSDKPCYQIHEDPLYKSIPFFMSSEGYGIFFDNTFKTAFNFKEEEYYSFSTPGGDMIYYFIYGPSFKKIITGFTELTGKPIMPPDWAFGFSQCRGLLTNEILTRSIAKGYRERHIPCDIIYQDIGWTEYLQDFEWKKQNYSNPVQMIDDLKHEGFKVIVSQDPVISQANRKQWKEADSLGYFTTDIRTGKTYDMPWPWGGHCGIVDFTNPEVADWWGAYQQKAVDDGVKGFWTDMGEPAWSNEENRDRLFMKHHLGMHDEIHNVYGLTWDKVVTEQFEKRNPNKRIFQMTRSGFAGMQRYTFGWSGDAGNGNDVTRGWRQLAEQIPISISAGTGLISFWSCDISGYCGDIDDYDAMSELYIRWLQFGAFNPLSRIHHEGNNAVEPWLFGENAERISKSAIENKYRLFPYIYSYAREAYDKGWPLVRALMFEYPEDEETFNLNSQFLFGKELLVAPVVREGAVSKKIYLPEGDWIDFNNKSTTFRGNQWIDFPVTLEHIPVFVKSGSIIPQMPVMQYINEIPEYPLILEIFPASTNRKASFEVYEDDGETNDYKKDLFVKRKIECSTLPDRYEISYTQVSGKNYYVQERNLIYILHLDRKPGLIIQSGRKLKTCRMQDPMNEVSGFIEKAEWSWDKINKICIIRIPSSLKSEPITVEN